MPVKSYTHTCIRSFAFENGAFYRERAIQLEDDLLFLIMIEKYQIQLSMSCISFFNNKLNAINFFQIGTIKSRRGF